MYISYDNDMGTKSGYQSHTHKHVRHCKKCLKNALYFVSAIFCQYS